MKLVKTASGKQTIKMSKKEWKDIGKKAGWMKEAQQTDDEIWAGIEEEQQQNIIKNKLKGKIQYLILAEGILQGNMEHSVKLELERRIDEFAEWVSWNIK